MSRHVNMLRQNAQQPEQSSRFGDAHPHDEQHESLLTTEEQAEADYHDEEAQKAAAKHKSTMLVISFVLMLIFGLANRTTQNLQIPYIKNYPLFLSLITTFIYIPVSLVYVLPMLRHPKVITPEARAIPWKVWFVIGALDSMAGIAQVLAMNIIDNGKLVVLLSQTAIPFSMITSAIWLKAKYSRAQYFGVFIILTGILLVFIPRFIHPEAPDPDKVNPSSLKMGLAVLAFVLANIPLCLSTVYKELTLGEMDVDPMYLNMWVAVYQLLFSIPLLIPSAYTESVAIKDIPQNLLDGAKCWVGINTIKGTKDAMTALGALYYTAQSLTSSSNTIKALSQQLGSQPLEQAQVQVQAQAQEPIVVSEEIAQEVQAAKPFSFDGILPLATPFASTLATQSQIKGDITVTLQNYDYLSDTFSVQGGDLGEEKRNPDNCGKAPIFTNLYMGFNVGYNILIIMLIKYGSANLLFLCLTITVPLASIFFALPFLPEPKPFSVWDVLGLIVLLIGLVIYRFYGIFFKPKETAVEVDVDDPNLDETGGINTGYAPTDNLALNSSASNYGATQGVVATTPGKASNIPYYGDVDANVEDPFGDNDDGLDGYEPAEHAPTVSSSVGSHDTTSHGRKKVKKGRK